MRGGEGGGRFVRCGLINSIDTIGLTLVGGRGVGSRPRATSRASAGHPSAALSKRDLLEGKPRTKLGGELRGLLLEGLEIKMSYVRRNSNDGKWEKEQCWESFSSRLSCLVAGCIRTERNCFVRDGPTRSCLVGCLFVCLCAPKEPNVISVSLMLWPFFFFSFFCNVLCFLRTEKGRDFAVFLAYCDCFFYSPRRAVTNISHEV